MIVSFRHKGLERLYREGSKKGVQADHVPKLLRILSLLDVAQVVPTISRSRRSGRTSSRATLPATGRSGQRELADHLQIRGWRCPTRRLPGLPLRKELNMVMKNPVHPGEILREDVLSDLGMSVGEAASRLGISRVTLSRGPPRARAGESEPGRPLEEAGVGTARAWLAMQSAHDLAAERASGGAHRAAPRSSRLIPPSCPIPEIARLGRTLKQWADAFLNYFQTGGANNGGTEAVNGLIELHRRIARGFRNRENYRLRMLLIAGGLDQPPPQV
ncbi:MAG: HigA family addiction module antitoxin [Propionicimonas sp.]